MISKFPAYTHIWYNLKQHSSKWHRITKFRHLYKKVLVPSLHISYWLSNKKLPEFFRVLYPILLVLWDFKLNLVWPIFGHRRGNTGKWIKITKKIWKTNRLFFVLWWHWILSNSTKINNIFWIIIYIKQIKIWKVNVFNSCSDE